MSKVILAICAVLMLLSISEAATVKYTLIIDVTYPYIGSNKPVVSANYSFPGPTIEASYGDTLKIRVINRMSVSTTLHWHGLYQRGTPDMDGAVGASQCPIPPGGEYTYIFKADPAGTAWYHGHWLEQYTDGLIGPLIIRRPVEPFQKQYDTEQILMIADWYNYPAFGNLSEWYLSKANPDGIEPLPDAIVVNGKFTRSLFIPVLTSRRIRFRIINGASLSMYRVSIDGLPLHVIELDQKDVRPYNVSSFVINVAQRVSFYINLDELHSIYGLTGPSGTPSIYIRIQAMTEMYPVDIMNYVAPYATQRHIYPSFFQPSYFAILSLDSTNAMPTYDTRDPVPIIPKALITSDTNLLAARPYRQNRQIIPNATHYLNIVIKFDVDENGINRGYMNNVTYTGTGNFTTIGWNVVSGIKPETTDPLLHQMVTRPNALNILTPQFKMESSLPVIQSDGYGHYLLPYGAVVDIFLNNTDAGEHPFHTHGYSFWIIATSDFSEAEFLYSGAYIQRDVVSIPANGWAKIRFVADNPGAWMFHCHIEWHMAAGLILTFINGPDELTSRGFQISNAQKKLCGIK